MIATFGARAPKENPRRHSNSQPSTSTASTSSLVRQKLAMIVSSRRVLTFIVRMEKRLCNFANRVSYSPRIPNDEKDSSVTVFPS